MPSVKKILLIEDDADLLELLAEQLELYSEFATDQADSGAAGLKKLEDNSYDVILLDIGLPDMDGRELCRLLRQAGVGAPIIMLTAADTDADTILGLDAGANDYVSKPFRIGVLLARIRAQLRQYEQSDAASLTIGPYVFQPGAKLLMDSEGKQKIRLTEKETAILKFLYRAEGRSVDRRTLLNEIWGYNSNVTTHTLETHIYRLRQKIEDNPAQTRIILTDKGGYRLHTNA